MAQAQKNANVRAGKRKLSNVEVYGNSANVATMMNVELDAGRIFSETEERHATPVAVIGYDVKDQLFPTLDPIKTGS